MARTHVLTPAHMFRVFAVVVVVLSLLYVLFDLSVNGPISNWTFELAVVRPVQSTYGFEAEWVTINGHAHLVVRRVSPNGRFNKAGVKPGYSFAPARCGWFALGGGWYALLSNATGPVSVALQTVPGDVRTERPFEVP